MKFEMPNMNVVSFESKEVIAWMEEEGYGPAQNDSTVI